MAPKDITLIALPKIAQREADVAALRTVDVLRAEPLHEGHGLGDPRFELGEGGLVVGIFRDASV
jgi:hypothetical protein